MDIETIKFNFDDLKSIKKAERKKARLENKGFNLIKDEKIGNFFILTYSKNL